MRRARQETFKHFLDRYHDILLVVGFALALRLVFLALTSGTYDYDEFVILLLSRDFAHGAVPYRDFMFFHPPGVLELYRLLEPLTALWWPFGRLITVLADTATAGIVWYLGRQLGSRREAIIAGLLYAVSPLALISAVRIDQDSLITVLGLGGLALLLPRATWRRSLLAGVLLAIAVWIKYPAVLFVPVYAMAAPRRIWAWGAGLVLTLLVMMVPFWPEVHALYRDTVTFQRTRWLMDPVQRAATVGIFWLLVNALAIPAIVRRRRPLWLVSGFALGVMFIFAAQVYYHYFVPIVPFAALLAAPLTARLPRLRLRLIATMGVVLAFTWAGLIDLGGPAPLYVTAPHLSDLAPTVRLLEETTTRAGPVLADRYEYAYLAHRPALAHYFWNVGTLVDARQLERALPRASAIVLSRGASSGYPVGFVRYLDSHYLRTVVRTTTVWLPRRPTPPA